ncbi:MAG TPA: zf-HC2 domain-containing protein [Candidatus Tectomicrobia bacterium]|nr:zf-HC2 domain-containing protein [Candidatus Tectomicrobia bacterium]
MTCREAIAVIGDYLESALGDEILRDLERHLRDCQPCVAYLNTYRRTRDLAADANRVEMPDEMRQRIREFLLAHLRERRP